MPWTAPAPRLREYVQSLRAIWTAWEKGERLSYQGKHYTFTLMPPYFVPVSQHLGMVPITLAAVGPHSLRLAGEVADGVRLHGFCTRRYLTEEILPRLAEGMARSGRDRASFEITVGASSPPVWTTTRWRRWSSTPEAASPSTGPPRVTGRCWSYMGSAISGASSMPCRRRASGPRWQPRSPTMSLVVHRHRHLCGDHGGDQAALRRSIRRAECWWHHVGPHRTAAPDLLTDIKRIPTTFTGYRTACSTLC